ncbi:hypothetical protein [Caulobacter sp. DWR3-1-2]|uniref:hypothetical protein n=1 Tax=Caulobacter sp. DWR3-1-2 TaxID=2804647 RepID=UPI003CF52CFC
MALITSFQRKPQASGQLQRTDVVGHYKVFSHDGQKRVLQIDTLGSQQREIPGKVSQTIQLSEDSARELWLILGKEFAFKT